ncbi:hypothetical protein NDU88_004289 [Pleurodeles waltl]|uniref:Uncharacterized protein n=1 Tax=Pleurodeles waltl TaxID=8319 RepID=A0AAV7MT13_PLEWA|nr:hypothetical protein NDU88_004289 [Pleurodeles waltl]
MSLFAKFKTKSKDKKFLEKEVVLPPKDTPARFMYNKHGMSAIVFLDLWVEYTEKLEEKYRWPSSGTFDIESILKVEEQLFKRKARQAQLDSVEWWRKEAHRRQEKAQNKVEKAQKMSEKAKSDELLQTGKETVLDQTNREKQGNMTGLYPVLPKCEVAGQVKLKHGLLPSAPIDFEEAPLIDLLDVPPPYSTDMWPVHPGPGQVVTIPPAIIDNLSEHTRHLSLEETAGGDEAAGGEDKVQCPHDPLYKRYPALDEQGKQLLDSWTKIEKMPAVQSTIDSMIEYMLRGGDSTAYKDVMKGKNKRQKMHIYTFMTLLFARYFQANGLKIPTTLADIINDLNEKTEEVEDEIDGAVGTLLALMIQQQRKFKEGPSRPTKQCPLRGDLGKREKSTPSTYTTVSFFPEAPTSEELYEETEEALEWFLDQEPPLTVEEQELARTATLWTSQPKIYNPDVIAQLFSNLPLTQRRLASIYMTQHLMTLNKIIRPHQKALEDLLSRCTSLTFVQDPSLFLNIFLEARQEYHDEVTRTLLRSRHRDLQQKDTLRHFPLREVHPRTDVGNNLHRVFVYTPLTKMEIMKMKEMVPSHSKDPTGFFKELADVLTMGTYTLADMTIMLKHLLPSGIYEKLREKNWVVDAVELNWANLETHESTREPGGDIHQDIKALPGLILKVLPQLLTTKKEDWDAISACKQKPGEDTGDYYSRLEECFAINSGLKPNSDSYPHLFVSKLVENSLPKLKERVQRVESSWQAQTPSQVLRILQYHQNRLREEEEREKTRLKETKIRALVAQTVMPRTGPQPQQQKTTTTSKGVCNYCKKQGHYVKDLQGNVTCPVLKHNLATGKTLSRPHVPREQYRTEGRVPKSQDREIKQSAQMYMNGEDNGYADFPSFF